MPIFAWMLDVPWGLITGQAIRFDLMQYPRTIEILSKTLYRALIIPEGVKVFVDNVPVLQFEDSFLWEGKSYRRVGLPMGLPNHKDQFFDLKLKLNFQGRDFDITLKSTTQSNTKEIKKFIRWQIDCFHKLLDLNQSCSSDEVLLSNCIRRSWEYSQQTWLQLDNDNNSVKSSIIVRMAQNRDLISAVKAIMSHPNKVLKRHRRLTKVSHASELDTACLRWYIMQPGANPQEKAGSKQKILAVVREETYDLLENRVANWVFKRLFHLTQSFTQQNELFRHTEKYKLVSNLSFILDKHLNSSLLKDVEPFGSCSSPNYVLMYHRYYNKIWKAFLELKKEERLEEDCWKWQSTLWNESGKQLFGALLTYLSRHTSLIAEEATSLIYILKEQMNGTWTIPPHAPGPFRTCSGRIDYIDLLEGKPEKEIEVLMQKMGTTQILRQKLANGKQKILIIWFLHQYESEELFKRHCEDCSMVVNCTDLYNVEISGLIFANEMSKDNSFFDIMESYTNVSIIKLSRTFHFDKLIENFKKIISVFL